MEVVTCFEPVIGGKPEVLILGTVPGKDSLERSEYYADSSNAFWYIVDKLFSIDRYARYDDRRKGLVKNGVAIWDVLKQAERNGSQDNKLARGTEVANNFVTFFRDHPSINQCVFQRSAATTILL